jgi:hypothetical protein
MCSTNANIHVVVHEDLHEINLLNVKYPERERYARSSLVTVFSESSTGFNCRLENPVVQWKIPINLQNTV